MQWRILVCCLAAAVVPGTTGGLAETIDFKRDVRPILSDACFPCHGPDAGNRQAELRLDVREDAVKQGAIVPGRAAESSLVERICSGDPDVQMPPPESHQRLSAAQRDLLKRRTDELGYNAVENVVQVRDLHATLLHLLGIRHAQFTVKYQGLDMRLTGIERARVLDDIMI